MNHYKKKNHNSKDSTQSETGITQVDTESNNPYTNEEIDESDDEYNLNTLGDFDLKHYEHFDIVGYDIEGQKIQKKKEDLIDEFIQSKTDKNAWRKIKDVKNNRIVELTDTDLAIIKRIRENKVGTRLNQDAYIYENDKEEYKTMPLVKYHTRKNYEESKTEKHLLNRIIRYLEDKEKHPERYTEKKPLEFYDLWDDKIFDDFNSYKEVALPHVLPGHKYSYNPPPELLFTKEEEEKALKKNANTFIPKNYNGITNIEYYKKTYFDLYQRCLDLYLCPRKVKHVANIKKEQLLPKLPSLSSLKPFPEFPLIKYNTDKEDNIHSDKNKNITYVDINERDHIAFAVQCNKLYLFDILTSYKLATIQLNSYFEQINSMKKKKNTNKKGCDNISIKVNKNHSVVAITYGSYLLLFAYECYVPPLRGEEESGSIEEIYHKTKKHKEQIDGKKQNDQNEEPMDEQEEDTDEDEDIEGVEFSEGDEEEEDNEPMNENENDKNQNMENKKQKSKSNNFSYLKRNMIYNQTKGLINALKNKFTNKEEYQFSSTLPIKWICLKPKDKKIKYCIAIKHEGNIKDFTWSDNGKYLSVTCLRKIGEHYDCYMHHIKSMKSIKLIKKFEQKRGEIVQTKFFPNRPYFAVAFENSIIVYNLKSSSKKKRIVKKLRGIKNVTSFDIHRNEEYVIASDTNGTVFIYDLDLSSNPYKKFHLQDYSVIKVEFHKFYNLFYALADNGIVNIFYAKFFQDYITNPVLLPIKQISKSAKILDLVWSCNKPWMLVHTENNFSSLYT